MKRQTLTFAAAIIMTAANVFSQTPLKSPVLPKLDYKALNRQAAREYLKPVHRGSSTQPYWNVYSKKFVYAPAFGFPATEGAAKYRYSIEQGTRKWTFTAATPNETLARVWGKIPAGQAKLTVTALARDGHELGEAGRRSFLRDFPYEGPYVATPRSYLDAAKRILLAAHYFAPTQYWLTHGTPDMDHDLNCYVSKIISATVRMECMAARFLPWVKDDALKIARSAADYMISTAQSAGAPLAYFPPTYGLPPTNEKSWPYHTREVNKGKAMFLEPVNVAHAYFDLYDATGDKKYYDQAVGILDTYKRVQNADGSYPIKVYLESGKAIDEARCTPAPLLFLIRRARRQYGLTSYDTTARKAQKWMEYNYVKSFNFTGQFEDSPTEGIKTYQNLTNSTAQGYANYLLTAESPTATTVSKCEEIMRFCEDQFAHWEMLPGPNGLLLEYSPCVHEQYNYDVPTDDSASNVGWGFLNLYRATGDKLWLAKSLTLTNSVASMLLQCDGKLPTTWEYNVERPKVNRLIWINCTLNSVMQLLRVAELAGEDVPSGVTALPPSL